MKMQGAAEHAFPPSKDFNPDVMGVQNWDEAQADLSAFLSAVSERDRDFRTPHGRRDEFHYCSPGYRSAQFAAEAARHHVGDLHIDSIRVKTRDFSYAKQPGGKTVHVWAAEDDWNPDEFRSNPFQVEWPPRSGRQHSFPELDRAGWFGMAEARDKILKGQAVFLDRLSEALQ